MIIVGEVTECLLGDPGDGMVHYQRRFWGVGDSAAS